jgi:SNF2 family DNA or RNA helicase
VRERLSRVLLRRRKVEVLADLLPKLVSGLSVPLTAAQRAAYDRAGHDGFVALEAIGAAVRVQNVLDLIVRLKQICNFDPASVRSSKLEDLRERVATLLAEGHKMLIFTQFANETSGARAIAAWLGIPALTYTGDLSPVERERVLARFREDAPYPVLVLALRTGGQGLNLQEASYVFHCDRWGNPAVEQQAESCSHRMGQRYPVNVYTYVCEDTIEERIETVLRDKQDLFDAVVEDAGIDLTTQLTAEDLFDLFGLRSAGAAAAPDPSATTRLSSTELERRVGDMLARHGW